MQQAQVTTWGQAPISMFVDSLPAPSSDEVRIKVLAVGINRLVRARAAGKHYSIAPLPYIPGVDGVGTTEEDQHVYFFSFDKGVLAEYVNLPRTNVFPLPDGPDPVQVAAGLNPAMASWMALRSYVCEWASCDPDSEAFGARSVIGAARDQAMLEGLGLDRTIVLADEAESTDFGGLNDVDVVLDFIYGPVTKHLLSLLEAPKPVQYVHIGALSTPATNLPGAILRSKDITIRGSGLGSWSVEQFTADMPELLKALVDIPPSPTKVVSLRDIEKEWEYLGKERLVVVP